MSLVENYFTERALNYGISGGPEECILIAEDTTGLGVGSFTMERFVLVPPFPKELTIVGFADDLTLVVAAKNPENVEDCANWLQKAGSGFSIRWHSNSDDCEAEMESILCY